MNKLEEQISNVFVMFSFIYNTCVIVGLDAAKEEIRALKISVNNVEREKREHVQSKHIELFKV